MELPQSIKSIIQNLADVYSTKELKDSAKILSDAYLDKTRNGQSFINNNLNALTYSIFRMPATFSAVTNAYSQIPENICNDIQSILDIGSGSGSASLAALYYFLNIESITCIEREKSMLEISKEIFKGLCPTKSINYINNNFINYDIKGKFDLIVASYSLNELKKEDLKPFLERLYNSVNKLLVVVEPGTPEGFLEIKEIREFFLKKGMHIIAPCPHESSCPIKNNDWCHFVTRLSRDKLHKELKSGDAPFEDEKYSYIVLTKDEVEIENNYRILRHPLIGGNSITLNVCSKNGIEDKRIFKTDKIIFKKAKKSKSGDIITID